MPRRSAAKKANAALLDDDDGDEDVNAKWTVNEAFAKRFTHNKQREDLQRLEELKKRGLAGSDSDDLESEDEDEDGKLSAKTDIQIFETLAKIKKKDPVIYHPEVKFYDADEEETGVVEEKKKKPLYLKDVQALHLLDGGDDEDEGMPKQKPLNLKTYADEQEELKYSFLRSVAEAEDADDGDLLRTKHRTKKEIVEDEAETAVAVAEAEQRKNDQDISRKLEDYFGKKDDDLNEDERFLKDFFLNEGWIDKDKNRAPTFADIGGEVSEDEAHLEETDKYEADYNFRFQENAGSQVMGNPRVVEGIVRKQGEKRKSQRQKKAERLANEKRNQEEELKRLKNLKKKEIFEKLENIKTAAGATSGFTSLGEDILEDDFDPKEYDHRMQEAFGNSYYQEEDAEIENEVDEEEGILQKPNFDDEDEELGRPKGWDKKVGFAAAHKAQKVSLKDKLAVEKNLEVYYKLDYEDMIGDLQTRFKYREVKPNTYGLDAVDILSANDKDLSQHVSIKKLAPYRGEEWEAPKYTTLGRKGKRKQALQDESSQPAQKSLKKKPDVKIKDRKKQESASVAVANGMMESEPNGDKAEPESEKKSKKRKRKMKKSNPLSTLPSSRVEAYGALFTPKKKKKKKTAAA